MKFLVDAQLPRRLCHRLRECGHDALHTLDLPLGNRTADAEIIRIADTEGRVVVTKDDEPYYGEVPEWPGAWATGRTLEECRQNLLETVEGWLRFRIAWGIPMPPLGDTRVVLPREMTLA